MEPMAEHGTTVWPAMRRLLLVGGLAAVWLCSSGFVVTPEYVGARARVPDPQRFEAIIGYPGQCVSGIPCWQYTKGTRSPVGSYPEAWYLHANGQRVRDKTYHFYVMNPLSGWAQHVASVCARQCFLDGMGAAGLGRMQPRPPLTAARWEQMVVAIVHAVRAEGKQALPNSVGVIGGRQLLQAAGQGSTESFTASSARALLSLGRVWVTERGQCAAKYAAFGRYRGPGDRFGCYQPPAPPWSLAWL